VEEGNVLFWTIVDTKFPEREKLTIGTQDHAAQFVDKLYTAVFCRSVGPNEIGSGKIV
jgi:hypothetical protein